MGVRVTLGSQLPQVLAFTNEPLSVTTSISPAATHSSREAPHVSS